MNQEYLSLRCVKDVSLVDDLAVNVGYSATVFLCCFPNASAMAVEPNKLCSPVYRRIGLLSRDLRSPSHAASSRSAICDN
jgi:hypothetical protein